MQFVFPNDQTVHTFELPEEYFVHKPNIWCLKNGSIDLLNELIEDLKNEVDLNSYPYAKWKLAAELQDLQILDVDIDVYPNCDQLVELAKTSEDEELLKDAQFWTFHKIWWSEDTQLIAKIAPFVTNEALYFAKNAEMCEFISIIRPDVVFGSLIINCFANHVTDPIDIKNLPKDKYHTIVVSYSTTSILGLLDRCDRLVIPSRGHWHDIAHELSQIQSFPCDIELHVEDKDLESVESLLPNFKVIEDMEDMILYKRKDR